MHKNHENSISQRRGTVIPRKVDVIVSRTPRKQERERERERGSESRGKERRLVQDSRRKQFAEDPDTAIL